MKQTFDLIVIGAGNAGLSASSTAKKAGLSVAIIEEGKVGGTCPLRGCVPKKVLVAAAEVMDKISHASSHCIQVGKPTLDWENLIKRKHKIIAPLSSSAEKNLETNGIELIRGQAQFVDKQILMVNDIHYKARKIIIATGSLPRPLSFPGGQDIITSDELLNLKELPKSLVFIGAGVIGFEFSHILARAGVKVTLLELASRILSEKDKEVVKVLVSMSEKLGITIITKAEVQNIEKKKDNFIVHFLQSGREKSIKSDLVANGAGRIPNIKKLNLEAAGVEYEGNYILLDKFLRSRSNPDVFVAGDPVDSPQLSPISTYEGKIVGYNLTTKEMISPDYSCIPSCIFTIPAFASVGLTEEEATKDGLNFDSKINDLTSWLSGLTYAETAAFSKVLIEKKTNRILGAHILGHQGQELINFFALAMKHKITSEEIKEMVFAYPTFCSDIHSML
jgi:glutathione reductase (NADPH)